MTIRTWAAVGREGTVRTAALQTCEKGRVSADEIACVVKAGSQEEAYECHNAAK